MKYCQSYVEMVERNARQVLPRMALWADYTVVRAAVEALGNIRLAEAEDALVNPAEVQCSDLYMQLREWGACDDGLTTVGHMCDYATLDRVFVHRPDWAEWYYRAARSQDEIDADEPYSHFDTYDEVNA